VTTKTNANGHGPAKGPGHGGEARGYSWAPFEEQNLEALVHGATSARFYLPLAEMEREAIHEQAPELRAARYAGPVWELAKARARLKLRDAWRDNVGLLDEEGNDTSSASAADRDLARVTTLERALLLQPESLINALSKLTRSVADAARADVSVDQLVSEGLELLRAREARQLLPGTEERETTDA
jgi:hypothetical protein